MSDVSFAPLFKRKSILLQEAPGDNNTGGGNNQTASDNQTRPTTTDTNLNIDTSANTGLGNDNDDTPNVEEGDADNGLGQNNTGEAEAKASMDSEAKEKDRLIFDNLTSQEQMLKIYTLKNLYKDLYERCDNIIKKYDTLGVEYEEYADIIKKSLDSLHALKEIISDYYTNLFDSKSYYENDVMFNRYLLVLNTIKLTTDEMVRQNKDEIEKSSKYEEGK